MLGVRRAGVTTALAALETREFIGRTRGTIVLLDRAGLEKFAGNFYSVLEAEQRRLTDWRA